MKQASVYVKYFYEKEKVKLNNTFDDNMKLQKLLLFANMVNLVLQDEPLFDDKIYAFKNGCVIENVRCLYNSNPLSLIKNNSVFTEQEEEVLSLTEKIFGDLDAKELSELNHQFDFWKNNFENSMNTNMGNIFYNKNLAIVSTDQMRKEKNKIKAILDGFKQTSECQYNKEIINGITFYYDPSLFNLTDDIVSELEDFTRYADEECYTIYKDESELVIY